MYKGDSPGKKVTRFTIWLHAIRIAQALHLPYHGAVVLAGEGGDLSTLKGLGYPMSTITAVDLNKEWLGYCGEVYPGVNTVHGELGQVSENLHYNVAHIDFCGGLSSPNIKTVADVVRNVSSHPAIIAVTMLKGREYKNGTKEIFRQNSRSVRRQALRRSRKLKGSMEPSSQCAGLVGEHLFTGGDFDPRYLLRCAEGKLRAIWNPGAEGIPKGIYKKNGDLGPTGSAMIRATALQECVEWLLEVDGVRYGKDFLILKCVGVMGYHSRSKKAHGTPFLTAFFIVLRSGQGDAVSQMILDNPHVVMFRSMSMEESLTYLQPTAAELARVLPAAEVAQMFDVSPASVVAWKAHATRGSYEREPLVRVTEAPEGSKMTPLTSWFEEKA